jgi:hypothetical protein
MLPYFNFHPTFICCVRALQHQQASSAFSLGSEFPNIRESPSRIHDKHKHLYPRRFFRLSILLFWGKGNHQKASCISGYASETWDHGLTALPNITSNNCFLFFSPHVQKRFGTLLPFYRHAVNSGLAVLAIPRVGSG